MTGITYGCTFLFKGDSALYQKNKGNRLICLEEAHSHNPFKSFKTGSMSGSGQLTWHT